MDGTGSAFVVDPERARKMDYTNFLWTEPYNLVVPKPQPVDRHFAFIQPFQPTVRKLCRNLSCNHDTFTVGLVPYCVSGVINHRNDVLVFVGLQTQNWPQ